jgi:hypothetical protein
MKRVYFNATVHYHKTLNKWQTCCEICWEGPKAAYGQGFASNCISKNRAVAAVSRHIKTAHGAYPVVRVGPAVQ